MQLSRQVPPTEYIPTVHYSTSARTEKVLRGTVSLLGPRQERGNQSLTSSNTTRPVHSSQSRTNLPLGISDTPQLCHISYTRKTCLHSPSHPRPCAYMYIHRYIHTYISSRFKNLLPPLPLPIDNAPAHSPDLLPKPLYPQAPLIRCKGEDTKKHDGGSVGARCF